VSCAIGSSGQLFSRRRGGRRESCERNDSKKTTTWRFGFFDVLPIDTPLAHFGIVSFRQFSVTEKAFARKKNKENRAIRNFPSELAF